uniref:Uncharacterized protein n=1 Tax=Medicago truncatula TaxID=3880 RepID=I3SD06_MEDTR|nr:unknown [Medicago truncatula]
MLLKRLNGNSRYNYKVCCIDFLLVQELTPPCMAFVYPLRRDTYIQSKGNGILVNTTHLL